MFVCRLFGIMLLVSALPVAAAVCDFEPVPDGTATPFTCTVHGVTTTFSSPDGGIFEVHNFPIFAMTRSKSGEKATVSFTGTFSVPEEAQKARKLPPKSQVEYYI